MSSSWLTQALFGLHHLCWLALSTWHNPNLPGKRLSSRDCLHADGPIGKTVEVIVIKLDVGRSIPLWVVLFPRPEVLNHVKVEKKNQAKHKQTAAHKLIYFSVLMWCGPWTVWVEKGIWALSMPACISFCCWSWMLLAALNFCHCNFPIIVDCNLEI